MSLNFGPEAYPADAPGSAKLYNLVNKLYHDGFECDDDVIKLADLITQDTRTFTIASGAFPPLRLPGNAPIPEQTDDRTKLFLERTRVFRTENPHCLSTFNTRDGIGTAGFGSAAATSISSRPTHPVTSSPPRPSSNASGPAPTQPLPLPLRSAVPGEIIYGSIPADILELEASFGLPSGIILNANDPNNPRVPKLKKKD